MYDVMTIPVEWKAVKGDPSLMEGYLSTFGNVDLGDDVVEPGAFLDTIKEDIKGRGGIPLLADHMASTHGVIGTIFDAKETKAGLWVKARISKAPSAQDVGIKMAEGHIRVMSMGYQAVGFEFADKDGRQVRRLKKVKLHEGSVVVFAMNPEATIEMVKTAVAGMDDVHRAQLAAALSEADGTKATESDVRQRLHDAGRERWGADGVDVWVDTWDVDEEWAVYSIWSKDDPHRLVRVEFSRDGDAVELSTDETEVRRTVAYTPKSTSPDDGTGTPGTSEGKDTAGSTAVEEPSAQPADGEPPEAEAEASAGHADADGWDRWRTEALLAGHDPDESADPAEVAGLQTRLELAEAALAGEQEPDDTKE